jgi:hypothetical protein
MKEMQTRAKKEKATAAAKHADAITVAPAIMIQNL